MATRRLRELLVEIGADLSEWEKAEAQMLRGLDRLETSFSRAGRTLSLSLTAPLAALGTISLRETIAFEQAMAGVAKTVDATRLQLDALGQTFVDMSEAIPVSRDELARLGELAGQLGIAFDQIDEFVRVVADMGVATNLASEEAATAFARLANIMQTPQTQFDRMGSTIVALGNNFATTEREIVEFAMRIAGAGRIAGLTEAQVLAIGTALSSVGIEAEAGGTAVQKVLLGITTAVATGSAAVQQFASVAGMSAREFAVLWEQDAAEAFARFVEGLSTAGNQAAAVLQELGLTDQRLIRTFLTLASSGDVLRRSIELGTRAWRENTALSQEAERFYAATGNQLRMLLNQVRNVAAEFGRELLPVFRRAIDLARTLVDVLRDAVRAFAALPEPIQVTAVALGGLLVAMGPLTFAIGAFAGAVKNLIPVLTALRVVLASYGPLLGPAGAILVGLSALAAMYLSVKRNALQAADAVKKAREEFARRIATASPEDLQRELEARQRRLAQLTPDLQRLRRSLSAAEQAGAERLAGSIRRDLEPLEREARELVRQINEIRTQLDTLGTAGGGGGAGGGAAVPPVLRLTLDNLRRLDEALRKTRDRLADLRFELVFETQADKAEKLREEIAATEERLRRLEDAARRAGDAFKLLSLPAPVADLAGAEWFQRAMTGRIDIATGKRQFPVIGGLMPGPGAVAEPPAVQTPALGAATRALTAFEIGLKDLNTSFSEAASVMGRLELAAFSVGRGLREIWDGLKAAGAQVARGFLELFNPLRMGSQALQRSFQEAAKVWEPLDKALAPVVQALADALRPAVEALAPVFVELGPVVKAIGQILAALLKAVAPILRAVVPILRALFPLIKLAAIGLTYLGQVVSIVGIIFFTVASGIAKAVGSVIEAIGKLIDKLPFVSGKGIINFGRNLKAAGDAYADAADSFKDAFKELGKARDEIRGIELDDALDPVREAAKETGEALRNVPSGFKIALERFRATTGIPVGAGVGATTTATSAGTQVVNDNRTINVTVVSDDPERIWREIQRRAERDGYRMHGTLVPAVG